MSLSWEYTSSSPEETEQLAKRLAEFLLGGDIITLEGDLGAGKTSFTKGLAKALGVKKNVNSPTFTIIKEYEGRVPFFHMDAYRIEDDCEDLGLEEYFEGDGVTVVEWPSMILDQLPNNRLEITIKRLEEMVRLLTFIPHGERYTSICKEIFEK
ncbi:tRNA (adenosine(37)-N6)-threonylcarbamoyltransferase complex ATPase subunit type 1 TsaE [Evansella sp. AB-P1]|uniref:tRNA (adenosine(37)-N6)-threonylcarbamoyltransferase complex ATPase subunit type 1 TsaE n=1 Tax=Evansella sp. AB-P1 TaxID=3037653 RepID=UPI00241F0111|nr:tRNA (adenosine(37)-N6)-threonylcarbamoyltransferase complex ATPase subunit type 1 TsaE [Evansella sp. AB-P1]MDG5785862.1 tRNA (adenosine(37)-N6)-threonylcarbamoyltransferase complex ATPase subunit type 1 TsaE [Evansella sp. AB-P1]